MLRSLFHSFLFLKALEILLINSIFFNDSLSQIFFALTNLNTNFKWAVRQKYMQLL